jgi:pimeloyl-ACP methyl ester carboxylesterase
MLGCADFDWAAKPAAPVVRVVQVRSDCIIERHVQIAAGHRLVTWVMRPPGEGPFPVLVWNHGSRIPAASWFGWDRTQDPTIDFDTPCQPEVARDKWMMVFPEGRGYGGSDGPLLAPRLSNVHEVLEFLRWRAADANEATRLIELRPDARKHCTVIGGVSHGGVTALFAAAAAPSLYRAVVIQATGVCYFKACGLDALETAANKVKVPLLVQHFVTDTRVPIQVSRSVAHWGAMGNSAVTLKEYPGVTGEEGHEVYSVGNYSQWIDDYRRSLSAALSRCDIEEREAEAPPAGAPSMLAAEEIVP